jgi:insulysin
MWRIFQLNKELSREGHVWRKFGSGNRETLTRAGRELKMKGKLNGKVSSSKNSSLSPSPIPSRTASPAPSVTSTSSEGDADGGAIGRETRRRLVEWWSKEYCASRMRLCVIGKGMLFFISSLLSLLIPKVRLIRRTDGSRLHSILTNPQPWSGSAPYDHGTPFRS